MRGALVLLHAGDRSPQGYPTRSPTIVSTLLRLANNLLEVGRVGWRGMLRGRVWGFWEGCPVKEQLALAVMEHASVLTCPAS